MSYVRFGLMILTSTVVMFVLMYLNTYALEHVHFSETRVYMALLMGASMALIMLGYMLGMYRKTWLNVAIFAAAVFVFALSLWLVRSQAVVSGPSYMRAMIPHHSIAIMTSERAQIRDPRVRKLADEIIEAQRREIAEMRYLIGELSDGRTVQSIHLDPPARPGTIEDSLNTTLISTLDLAPMTEAEADRLLEDDERCTFSWSRAGDPVFWIANDGAEAAMKLNDVLVPLQAAGSAEDAVQRFSADGGAVQIRSLAEDADWRQNAELVLEFEAGLTVGYHGFLACRRA